MSNGWLLAVGALVTLIVSIGVALPIYGAILDGRDTADRRDALVPELSETRAAQRSAA